MIGAVLIDSGAYQAAGIPARLISPKDFSCDSIVLTLYSEDSVSKLLLLNGHQDPCSIVVTCLNLFFMRVHLFAVNSKHELKPVERVQMLWHSFCGSFTLMVCP